MVSADDPTDVLSFPPNFLWGVSSAAHQVEGGNGNSLWASWEAAGRIKSGDECGLACDWWKNAEHDFDLARGLGLNSVRLSVEWSRIEPQPDVWDDAALDRYRTMLLALRDRGLRPFLTLHHFSHPLWFEQRGGFLSSDVAALFLRFARRVVGTLGDLCQDWVTFNEPNVYAALGYVLGEFPPGKKGKLIAAIRVLTAMARAHAETYHVIHQIQPAARVGWAHNYVVFQPARPKSKLDGLVTGLVNELFNESFLRLIEDGRLSFPLRLVDGNTQQVRGTCDFVGLNVYSRFNVQFDLRHGSQLFGRVFVPGHVPQGDSGVDQPYGEAFPQAVRVAVERVSRMGKPVYILENGVPDAEDRIRPWLMVNAVKEVQALIWEGHDIRGYFHWALTDNFEWSEGWKLRFGLYALDPATQERSPRRSAEIYRSIAQHNGLSPELTATYAHDPTHR